MVDEKLVKAAKKEGGKKGQDMAGVNDMGGVKFFNLVVETPEGDPELLLAVLEGMNTVVDEAAEERRGGAGELGKMLLSSGAKQLSILCHVPKALQESQEGFSIKEWVETVAGAAKATIVEEGEELFKAVVEADPEKDLFPIKLRDSAQAAGIAYLRDKKLLPDEDSDDDYVLDPEAAGIEW